MAWLHNLKQLFLPSNREAREARRRSREIDAMLKRECPKPVMIVVIGWDNSGKTTFFKQMRIIHGVEFNHDDLLQFRAAIYKNIMEGMRVLIKERKELGIPLQNSANEMHETLFQSCDVFRHLEPSTFQPYVGAVDSLWKDSSFQEAHRRRSNSYFGLYESVKHYFDNIHRIGQLNYLPNNQDILYTHRLPTERCFVIPDSPFVIITYCVPKYMRQFLSFSVIQPVLFFVGSSDYDKIEESLKLFDRICNRYFIYSPIFIIFNKMDLLAEKIQTTDIRKHFPEFQGDPRKLEDVQEFLVQSFKKRKPEDRMVFYHMTTAVDTQNIQTVFNIIKDAIMGRYHDCRVL